MVCRLSGARMKKLWTKDNQRILYSIHSSFMLNSPPTQQDANDILCKAQAARASKKLDKALEYYQIYLEVLMLMYKAEPAGTDRRTEIYLDMEKHMVEAENLKQEIEREKTAAETAPTSIFSAFTSMFSSSSTSETKASAAKKSDDASTTSKEPTLASSKPAKVSNSKAAAAPVPTPTPVPDFHDYTAEMRRKKADIAASIHTARQPPTHPTAAQQQQAATQRLHSGRKPSPTNELINSIANNARSNSGTLHTNNTNTTPSTKQLLTEAPSKKRSEYEVQILEGMLDKSPNVKWEDIAGLAYAKQTLQETVILPNLRPDLFTGLRSPPKGVLLFGPPGTGKTMLAKAVASESDFCFFSMSASSLTSKYLGEGEKLMKALFEIAREKQPSVIFFDEIDALMSVRKENEHEASRRLKTEFMVQVDGATTNAGDRLLIMAATNIPWEIDEAVLRRLVKRIYIPLPDLDTRRALITHLLTKQGAGGKDMLAPVHLERIAKMTEGYSGSDLTAMCQEASLGPIRELGPAALRTIKAEEVRPLNEQDFANAVRNIRPSVSKDNLETFQKWAEQYGVAR